MKIVMATFGSYGDIYPFIRMGRVLGGKGYDIVFLANPFFEEQIKKEGFDFKPIGTLEDYHTASKPAVSSGSRLRDKKEQINASRRLYEYMFFKPVKQTFSTVSEYKHNDVIVIHHFFAYGAKLAAEKHGLPGVNICLAPYWLKSFNKAKNIPALIEKAMTISTNRFIDNQLFTKPFNAIRMETGMEPLGKSSTEWMFDGKTVCLFPEWFSDLKFDGSKDICYLGFPGADKEDAELSEEYADFLQKHENPVVFTPGSAFRNVDIFFSEAAATLDKLGKPGVFLTRFKDEIPGRLPDNIICADFIPLDLLLDKCSCIVHHGGIGTCSQAMRYGVPQLICHRLAEQVDNARLLKKIGVCEDLPYNNVNRQLLTVLLRNLLSSKDVHNKCEEIKDRLTQDNMDDRLTCCLKTNCS